MAYNIPNVQLGGVYTFQERAQSMGISPIDDMGAESSHSTRVYDIAWRDRVGFVKQILGYPKVSVHVRGTGPKPWIMRNIPHVHESWTQIESQRPFLYASRAKVTGLTPINEQDNTPAVNAPKVPRYDTARVSVEYQTFPYDILTDQQMVDNSLVNSDGNPSEASLTRYVSKTVRPSGRFFTVPTTTQNSATPGDVRHSYFYQGTNTFVATGLGKLIGESNVILRWHQVPESVVPCRLVNKNLVGPAAIDQALGRVNGGPNPWNGYPIGTLLLMSVELRPYRSAFGDRIYDIDYFIRHLEPAPGITHQHIFRPGTGWVEVLTAASAPSNFTAQTDGLNIYDWAPYDDLFTPIDFNG